MFVTELLRARVAPALLRLDVESGRIGRDQMALRKTVDPEAQERIRRALERRMQIAVECTADIGNAMIDALLMRDPASYTDIVTVLGDEGVITPEVAAAMIEVVSLRRYLVQEYLQDHDVLLLAAASLAPVLTQFVVEVRAYLDSGA